VNAAGRLFGDHDITYAELERTHGGTSATWRDATYVLLRKITRKLRFERGAAKIAEILGARNKSVKLNIPKGKRSLAFSLAYQNPSGTFTDQEIQGLQERVGSELKSRFQAEFR
jgi:hypothetical protein